MPPTTQPQVTNLNTARLGKLQGETKMGSVRSPHRMDVATNLTPQRLASVMRQADEGGVEPFLILCQEMEERDPHYRSVLHTRKMAVSGIVPRVELPNDAGASREIAQHVEERITKNPKFEGLVFDLMDGVAKGFSCVEIDWRLDATEWYPVDYRFREQRHFVFDRDTMRIPLLRHDRPTTGLDDEEGDPLTPLKWLVHIPRIASGIPIRCGLARTQAVAYAAKRWTCADWMAFLDIFGVPIRIGKYPAAYADKKGELLRAVRRLGSDAAAVIPSEMSVELIETKTSGGGQSVFVGTVEYWDKQTSKLVLGQTMTTDDGASLSQSKTHETVRFDIRDADGRGVSATINEQLIQPFVVLNHGEQKVYPECVLYQKRPEDIVPLMTATKTFVDMGGTVQMSEARDRLGYMEPEEGAELLEAPTPPPVLGAPPDNDNGSPKGTPGKGAKKGKGAKEGDDVERDGSDVSLNAEERAALAEAMRDYDATDEATRLALEEWKPLLEGNVGRLMAELQNADTFDAARAKLDELAKDQGEVLDVGALVVSLSRTMLKLRGVGSATDDLKP